MKQHRIAFEALDGEHLTFNVPKGCNRYLVTRAIQRLHRGEDADLVDIGLTRAETTFIAEVVAELEDHRPEPKPDKESVAL